MQIELEEVSYAYEEGPVVLKDIDLSIEEGSFVGLMGRTGCGKTTLIQLIAGLLVPFEGKVLIDGKNINSKKYDRSELRRKVGVVFQYPEYQLFETTVEKDVAFGLKYSGLDREDIRQRVKEALETMGFCFENIRLQSPLALSGGEKRRVAIAGVLAVKPKILLFDEPVAGLDPLGRESFLQLLSHLNNEGTTIIMVSHNADALAECAKRLIVLENGRIAQDGTVSKVFFDIDYMKSLHVGVSTARLVSDMLLHEGIAVTKDTVRYDQLLCSLRTILKGKGSL